MRRSRRVHSAGCRKRSGPLTAEHKGNISAASKRPKVSHIADDAAVDLPDCDAPDGKIIAGGVDDVVTVDDLFGDLDGVFAEDATGRSSGLKSVQKPVAKKINSKHKGHVMACLPSSGEDEGGEEDASGIEEALARDDEE